MCALVSGWTVTKPQRIMRASMLLRRAGPLTAVLGLVAACGSDSRAMVDVTCAPVAFFQGRTYMSRDAVVHPDPARVVGEITVSGCNDRDQDDPPRTRRERSRRLATLTRPSRSSTLRSRKSCT